MDIFNASKRLKEESIKKPLNYPESQVTEEKLSRDHQRQVEQFNLFLRKLYTKFNFKVNNCKQRCISKANSYKEVGACEEKCEEGTGRFSSYVDSRVSEMQQLLGDCVANTGNLHNAMDQIYYCYEIYNNGFSKLKQFIAEQSMFYQ